jgi:hypothetical protein
MFAPGFLDELRRRVRLGELIGSRLELVRSGRELVGLCPFHDEKTPSFYVVETKGFFHCFGCGAHGDAIEFLRRFDNLDFRAAVTELARAAQTAQPVPRGRTAPLIRPLRRDEEERNRRIAWRIWTSGRNPRGTPVEAYLHSRGLSLPPAPVLRWTKSCWNRETGRELPAMLARIDGPDGKFLAVHRTWLRPDGSDKAALAEPKRTLGSWRGGAVHLAPAGPLLAIAEGIEDALSVLVATRIPAWSAVSKGGFKGLVLPAELRELLIISDNDRNGHGQLAARRAAERWAAKGRRVRLALPPRAGEDVNDLLRKGGDERCAITSIS